MSFLLSWVFYIPCFVLGMPAEVFVSVASLNLIYQFWVHTRFIPELGPVEWVLVTPSNHRVHHARNPDYIDKNYGGVFIIWDRLFGTYCREQADVAVDYGITRGLNSWNPLWANLHVYWGMLTDSIYTKRWQDKIKVWLGPTAFVPSDIDKGELRLGKRFDPVVEKPLRNYVLLQFLVVVAMGVVLKYQISVLGEQKGIVLFLYMLFSLMVLGWLLEGRKLGLEIIRLLFAPLLAFFLMGSVSWLVLGFCVLSLIVMVFYRRDMAVVAQA